MKSIRGFSLLAILVVLGVIGGAGYYFYTLGAQASKEIVTLTEELPVCTQKNNMLSAANHINYSAKQGVYSYFTSGDKNVPLHLVSVNEDRTICSCTRKQTGEVQYFDYGVLNERGLIEWNEEKFWPSKPERLDNYNQAVAEAKQKNPDRGFTSSEGNIYGVMIQYDLLFTAVAGSASRLHIAKLPEDGCVSGGLNLYPVSATEGSKADACGCDGHGIPVTE